MRAIGVGLLGLGNVRSGLIKLLDDNREAIADRIGARVDVRRILVREVDKPRLVDVASNYILSRMAEEGRPFAEVLADAQAHGYAEADPALDVDGWDAAHKLCILTSLCFAVRVHPRQLLVEGLRDVAPIDFHYAEKFGYVIKPLAIARDHGDSVEARVHPTMIPRRFLLATVSGV